MAGSARGMPSVEDIAPRSSRLTLATISDSSSSAGIAGSAAVAGIAAVAEARRLQLEHRPVAAAGGHQLVVGAELDHSAVLEHADAVGVAHRREAMRDQDGGGVAGRGGGGGRAPRPPPPPARPP